MYFKPVTPIFNPPPPYISTKVPVAAELSGHGYDGTAGHYALLAKGGERDADADATETNDNVAVTTLYTPKDIEDRIKKLTNQLKTMEHTGGAVAVAVSVSWP